MKSLFLLMAMLIPVSDLAAGSAGAKSQSDELSVTASFSDKQAVQPSEPIEFRLNRGLKESDERLGILIGNTDVSSLFSPLNLWLRYDAKLWPLPLGESTVTVYLVSKNDEWEVVGDLSFSPDGQLLASNLGGIARLWEVSSGKEARRFLPAEQAAGIEAERMLLAPNGKFVAVHFRSAHDPSYSSVRVWDLDTHQEIVLATEIYLDWRFSGDSRLLAVTAIADKGKPSERSVAEIWDPSTGKRVKLIEVPHEWRGAYSVAFSPDSKLLAIGGYKKFGIFSIETGQVLANETHRSGGFFQDSESPNQLSHVEFSPDGQLLLTGGNDGTVKLWTIAAG